MRTANRKVVSAEGMVFLIVNMREIGVSAWFRVVRKLAIDVLLGMLFIDQCICGMFSSE